MVPPNRTDDQFWHTFTFDTITMTKEEIPPLLLLRQWEMVDGTMAGCLVLLFIALDDERAALYPEKLIQSLVALQRLVFVKAGCHCDIAVQTRIQLVGHRLPLFVKVTKIANILFATDYFPTFVAVFLAF